MKCIRNLFILVIFCYLFFSAMSPIDAQQVSLSFDHAVQEVTIKPGNKAILDYTFTNLGDPTTVSFKMIGLEQKNMTGEMNIRPLSAKEVQFTLLNPDLTFDKPLFMRSKETKTLQLEASISAELASQDYYYALLAATQPQPSIEGATQLRVQNSIGTTILVQVTDKKTELQKPSIALFALKTRLSLPFGSKNILIVNKNDIIPVYLSVENPSETFTNVEGTIRLTQIKGKHLQEIQTYTVPPHYISSHYQRLLRTSSQNCPDKKDTNCKTPASTFIQLKNIGYYQVASSITDQQKNTVASRTFRFLVIPLWEIVILFCTIIALLIIFLTLHCTKK